MNKNKEIYIASKTKHAHKWIELRQAGANIISTWIDEAGKGQSRSLFDLARRCVKESISCDAMIVYCEEGDILKGAFIEMGIALSVPMKPIYLIGNALTAKSVFMHLPNIYECRTVEEAIELISL